MNEQLIKIAQQYTTPEEFKAHNFAKYSICKSKGLLRKAFPTYVKPLKVHPKPLPTQVVETPSDANLRHAIDDMIVRYRGRPALNGKIRKVTVNAVIKELEEILSKY